MKSVGKTFEENWRKSIPQSILYYRPPDSAQSFGGSDSLRFSPQSPCDCILYDGDMLYILELKSVGGKAMSFERDATEKGMIHKHQIDSLEMFSNYRNVESGFLFDFRLSEKTYFCRIDDFVDMMNKIEKKSFNEKDLYEYCNPIEISKRKLRVNYRYDVEKLIADIKQRRC